MLAVGVHRWVVSVATQAEVGCFAGNLKWVAMASEHSTDELNHNPWMVWVVLLGWIRRSSFTVDPPPTPWLCCHLAAGWEFSPTSVNELLETMQLKCS
ncbi:hypothetical protein TIFTF001_015050 [Ficus carica]|uniref:Uncharacterized protein n=1 Tax=Ficus carica TaxID=3494 RepID=A0AA88A6G7_FICCA|nr:hypothetical protein TIFTF001_015050 [Ficus carica]